MCKLIGKLEYIVGNQFYRIFDKETFNVDRDLPDRIPVCYSITKKEHRGTSCNLAEGNHISEKIVNYMNYYVSSDGSCREHDGRLLIGRGLKDVLDYLEEKHNSDLNDLEESHK